MMDFIHGTKCAKNRVLAKIIEKMVNHVPKITTLQDFKPWTHKHPVILHPILTLQLKLKQELIGESFWERLTSKRAASFMQKPGFVSSICHAAQLNIERMLSEAKAKDELKRKENMLKKKRRSIDIAVEKIRKSFSRHAKIVSKEERTFKIPEKKRRRRSFIKPNLKIEGATDNTANTSSKQPTNVSKKSEHKHQTDVH